MGWESNAVFQIVIITGAGGSGLFVYSPTPGAGKLVASIAAAAGHDAYGNNYLAGLSAYKTSGAPFFAAQLAAGNIVFYTGPAAGGPWTAGPSVSNSTTNDLLLTTTGTGQVQINLGAIIGGLLTAQGGISNTGGLTTDTELITSSQSAALLSRVTNTFAGASNALVQWIVAAVNDNWLRMRVSGDTQNRWGFDWSAAGFPRLHAGSGTLAVDTFLARAAPNQWVTSPLSAFHGTAAETDQTPTFANSWATTSGRANTTYRIIPVIDTMEWVGGVTVPVGFAANQNMTTANPAAYQPLNTQSLTAWDTATNLPVRLAYLTTGILQFIGPVANTAAGHNLDIPCQQIRLSD